MRRSREAGAGECGDAPRGHGVGGRMRGSGETLLGNAVHDGGVQGVA